MDIKIKRLYELVDDLQTLIIGDLPFNPDYTEIYARKIVDKGISRKAFVIRAQTFYEVVLSHIPGDVDFILSPKLSRAGIICNYNKQTKQLFLYNCTQNQIYIEENESIGVTFDG